MVPLVDSDIRKRHTVSPQSLVTHVGLQHVSLRGATKSVSSVTHRTFWVRGPQALNGRAGRHQSSSSTYDFPHDHGQEARSAGVQDAVSGTRYRTCAVRGRGRRGSDTSASCAAFRDRPSHRLPPLAGNNRLVGRGVAGGAGTTPTTRAGTSADVVASRNAPSFS